MKKESLIKMSLFALILFIGFGALMSLSWFQCPDWNDYWKEEFDKGQCEEVCNKYNESVSSQDPDDCWCGYRSKIHEKRPLTMRQQHVLMWC